MEDLSVKKDLFETVPVPQAILRLALPSVMGQVVLVIYNMADTFFIGQTGSDAMITAVTVCMPAFLFLSAIANLFGVGGASVISRALGKGDCDWAKDVAAFSFAGCLGLSAVYSLGAFLLLSPFINALGGSAPLVHGPARAYLICTVVLGGLPTALNGLLAHLIRAEGHSMSASLGVTLGGVLNIALDPLFMFVILPPGQEVLGAAIATALSNVASLLYFAILIFRKRGHTVLTFLPRKAMLSRSIPKDVVSTGLPACLMTLFENISYAVLESLMALSGTVAQAGIGVAKKVNMLSHCIVRGMAQGVLPLIGYNYASKNRLRMRRVVTLSTLISVAVATVCTLLCLLFSRSLIGIFIQSGSDSLEYGARFLRILCLGAPFSACAYACISFFQAVGRGKKSFLLAILRKGILDIPLMFILQAVLPVYGIVWATPIADLVCCVLALWLFFRFLRKHASRGASQGVAANSGTAA